MNWPVPGQTSLFQGYRVKDSLPQDHGRQHLVPTACDRGVSVEKIMEAGKAAFGQDWQNHNVVEILTTIGRKPQPETLLELQTLDTNETVEITVRPPEKN